MGCGCGPGRPLRRGGAGRDLEGERPARGPQGLRPRGQRCPGPGRQPGHGGRGAVTLSVIVATKSLG